MSVWQIVVASLYHIQRMLDFVSELCLEIILR